MPSRTASLRELLSQLDAMTGGSGVVDLLCGDANAEGEEEASVDELGSRIAEAIDQTQEKVDAIAARLLAFGSDAAECKRTSKLLAARAAALERRRRWLTSIVLEQMERRGWNKLRGVRTTLTRVAGRESVSVDDADALPDSFKKCTATITFSREQMGAVQEVLASLASQTGAQVGEIETSVDKLKLRQVLEYDEVKGASISVGEASLRAYISG